MSGDFLEIRSDLSICEETPAIKINVKFSDLQQELSSGLPENDNMLYYSAEAEAGVAVLK